MTFSRPRFFDEAGFGSGETDAGTAGNAAGSSVSEPTRTASVEGRPELTVSRTSPSLAITRYVSPSPAS